MDFFIKGCIQPCILQSMFLGWLFSWQLVGCSQRTVKPSTGRRSALWSCWNYCRHGSWLVLQPGGPVLRPLPMGSFGSSTFPQRGLSLHWVIGTMLRTWTSFVLRWCQSWWLFHCSISWLTLVCCHGSSSGSDGDFPTSLVNQSSNHSSLLKWCS